MGGGVSLQNAFAEELKKPVDASDFSDDADPAVLRCEIKRLRALLARTNHMVDTNNDNIGDTNAEAIFMSDEASPDKILTTPCNDVEASDDTSITFTSWKMKNKSVEGKWRQENTLACQFGRWNWVQNNPKRWINMLRRAGYTDEDIDLCNSRQKPLDFLTHADYDECRKDLLAAAAKIEARTGVTGARFIQQGSSCTGFSTNPNKGLRFIPTHIYHDTSDTDFRFIAEGIDKLVAEAIADKVEGIIVRPGTTLLMPESGPVLFPELKEVSDKWAPRVRGKSKWLQFTIVSGSDGPASKSKLWDLPV